jgi:hypothetical protein
VGSLVESLVGVLEVLYVTKRPVSNLHPNNDGVRKHAPLTSN